MAAADKKQLMAALEAYRDQVVCGNELLSVWEQADEKWQAVYYNLFHLVADEDIRNRDAAYRAYQLDQLDDLIEGMKNNQPIEVLKQIAFL